MLEPGFNMADYQANTYLQLIRQLTEGLPVVQDLIGQAEALRDPGQLDQLTDHYTMLFGMPLTARHLRFEIGRVYKPLFLADPGPFDKYNSYYHLVLQPASPSILALDGLYSGQLTRLLKLYQHVFAKINHFFVDFETSQLAKYANLLDKIRAEVAVFLDNAAHRETLSLRETLKAQHLSHIPFGALFNIAATQNLPGILQRGILSHNGAHGAGMVRMDISNQDVNRRRDRVADSLGANLHDYAPLYLNPKNATFFYWCRTRLCTDIALLKVNPNILLDTGVAFSDGNAAVTSTRFYQNIEDFNRLNWSVIQDEYWTGHPDGKRIKCAEVLVKDRIPLHYIDEIFVFDQAALEKVLPLFPNHLSIPVRVNPDFYY